MCSSDLVVVFAEEAAVRKLERFFEVRLEFF